MVQVLVDKKTDDPITQIVSYVGSVHYDRNPLGEGCSARREFNAVFYKLFTEGLETS